LAFFVADSSIAVIDVVGVKLDARVVRAEKHKIHHCFFLFIKIYYLFLFRLFLWLYLMHQEVDLIHSNFLVLVPKTWNIAFENFSRKHTGSTTESGRIKLSV
jgi:hypothetical protein